VALLHCFLIRYSTAAADLIVKLKFSAGLSLLFITKVAPGFQDLFLFSECLLCLIEDGTTAGVCSRVYQRRCLLPTWKSVSF